MSPLAFFINMAKVSKGEARPLYMVPFLLMKYKAVFLVGPTATGKTQLALTLANEYPIEIISVDSTLVYQDMDIGSAKPSIAERIIAPHHLIDIISPLENYSVAQFIVDAVRIIKDVSDRGNIPLLVGGTMMYCNALINGISKLPQADYLIRVEIENELNLYGLSHLFNKLVQIDEISALKIKPNDFRRISRALEVYYLTGQPLSKLQIENKYHPAHDIDFLLLSIAPTNRDILHERISLRLDQMWKNGFVEEVKHIKNKYPQITSEHTSMKSIGYSHVWQYLEKIIDEQQLHLNTLVASRQLAKRQMTWLRSMSFTNLVTQGSIDFDNLFSNLLLQMEKYCIKVT